MSKRRTTQHHGLGYRRTKSRPGWMICRCPACHEHRRVHYNKPSARQYPSTYVPAGCSYINREAIFAEEWEAENVDCRGVNFGFGILQDLMMRLRRGRASCFPSVLWHHDYRPAFIIKYRERVIVATVVQWLGSNVGWCFLERCLRRCGYTLVQTSDFKQRAA